MGQSPRPSFGAGAGGSGNAIGGGKRPSFGGGSSGSRPSFGGGSSGSRPGFGGGSAGSRPSLTSGTSGSVGGSSSQDSSEANEANNFGFPERLGKAGIDFPIYDRMNMPLTSFTCEDKENGGYVSRYYCHCAHN